ncbi:MAG TPA: flagellar hook-associated protein FlgK, partial [Armatimonadota bacterium]|nr:flagellar hook-associated protein FlgK [Armatimonadota bacterium]
MSLRLLQIARTSLLSQRTALEIIGQNIANVDTPGYVRQRPVLQAVPGAATSQAGGGVEVVDVQRLADELLIIQTRYQSGWLGQEQALRNTLEQVEHLFTDVTEGGVAARLEEMFDAWADLGLQPTSAAAREQVIQRAQLVAEAITGRWQGLDDLRWESDQRLQTMVGQANRLAYEVAGLNERLAASPDPSTRNDLMSQRDELVNRLSELCGAEIIRQDNDVVDVVIGGIRMVELGHVTELHTVPDPDQPGMHLVALGELTLAGELRGEMAGRLQARDDVLPQYMARLDELAATLADQVNALHTA